MFFYLLQFTPSMTFQLYKISILYILCIECIMFISSSSYTNVYYLNFLIFHYTSHCGFCEIFTYGVIISYNEIWIPSTIADIQFTKGWYSSYTLDIFDFYTLGAVFFSGKFMSSWKNFHYLYYFSFSQEPT